MAKRVKLEQPTLDKKSFHYQISWRVGAIKTTSLILTGSWMRFCLFHLSL